MVLFLFSFISLKLCFKQTNEEKQNKKKGVLKRVVHKKEEDEQVKHSGKQRLPPTPVSLDDPAC